MDEGYDSFSEKHVKHLELLQAVIGRLGNDSFLVKGWAVTVAGVFLGFAVNSHDASLALASLLSTAFFWGLDTYFLRSERLFRVLYDYVRRRQGIEPFFMAATSDAFMNRLSHGNEQDQSARLWRRAFWSPTLRTCYGGLAVSALVVALLIGRIEV
jgi:hypothetical protein